MRRSQARLSPRHGAFVCLLLVLAAALAPSAHSSLAVHSEKAAAKDRFLSTYGKRYGYGYGGRIDKIYAEDVAPRFPKQDPTTGLPENHYLDYTAASLYRNSQLQAITQDQLTHVYGNPHCFNPSARAATEAIDEVKRHLLDFWGVTGDEYEIVITRSGTGALQLIGEMFPWTSQQSSFLYTRANHNSVLGIRSYACKATARVGAVDEEDLEEWITAAGSTGRAGSTHGSVSPASAEAGVASSQDRPGAKRNKTVRMTLAEQQHIAASHTAAQQHIIGSDSRPQMQPSIQSQIQPGSSSQTYSGSRDAMDAMGSSDHADLRVVGPRVLDPHTGVAHGRMSVCHHDGGEIVVPDTGNRYSSSTGGTSSSGSSNDIPNDQAASHDVAYSLFAYPACENFAGAMYPDRWVRQVRSLSTSHHKWLVLVDTAATVPHHAVNLTELAPDFAVVSFYKMFGIPTGVGALLVRKETIQLMRPGYWGGGTVFLATAGLRWHLLHPPPERLQFGTLPFLEIIALKHGLKAIEELGGMHAVSNHTFAVAEYLHDSLVALKHPNGAPMVRVSGKWGWYKSGDPRRRLVQGPTVNFEVLQPDGQVFSYKVVGKEASDKGLHVRWGCMCNPGACYNATGVTEEEVRAAADAAIADHPHSEDWEDVWEWVNVTRRTPGGKLVPVRLPLGALRTSFGWMSRFEDAYAMWQFVNQSYYGRWDVPEGSTVHHGALRTVRTCHAKSASA